MNFILNKVNPFFLSRQRSQVSALMQKCDTPENLLMHSAIGIMGETVELLEADEPHKRVEEMGDILFYHDALLIWQETYSPPLVQPDDMHRIPAIFSSDLAYLERALLTHSAAILDLAKKNWAYGQAPRYLDIELQRQWYMSTFQGYANALNVEMEEILENNWRKLTKRYPNHQFTTEASIARADEKTGG